METLGLGIMLFLVGFVLFMILRSLLLWYWKINLIVQKLDGILNELKARSKF